MRLSISQFQNKDEPQDQAISSHPQDQAVSMVQVRKYQKILKLISPKKTATRQGCQCDKDATRANTDGSYSHTGHQVFF